MVLLPTVRSPVARTSKRQKASDWQRVCICCTRGLVGSPVGTKTGTKEGLCFGPKKKWRSKYSVSYVNNDVAFLMAPAGGKENPVVVERPRDLVLGQALWNRHLALPLLISMQAKGKGGLALQQGMCPNAP